MQHTNIEDNNKQIKRCAVFAHFDKNNKIQKYVLYYLEELKKVADTIIFVSDCNLEKSQLIKIKTITPHVLAQKHGEYDFGSYKYGFLYLKENNLLENCDELIFCNDSCYGPLYPFNEMFDKMQKKDCDFWGATFNTKGLKEYDNGILYEYDYPHVQSFFLVFRPNVFSSEIFSNFVKNIKKEKIKWDIIINYEIGLTELLNKNGFKHSVFCEYSLCRANSYLTHYLKLILKDRNPLIKTSIFRSKEKISNDLRLIDKYTNYNKNLILSDLKANSVIKRETLIQKIFSIKNHPDKTHKIITILGIKIKIKTKKR